RRRHAGADDPHLTVCQARLHQPRLHRPRLAPQVHRAQLEPAAALEPEPRPAAEPEREAQRPVRPDQLTGDRGPVRPVRLQPPTGRPGQPGQHPETAREHIREHTLPWRGGSARPLPEPRTLNDQPESGRPRRADGRTLRGERHHNQVMPLRGVMAGSAVALLFASGVAAALADPPPTTSTGDSTTGTAPTTTTVPTSRTTTTT